MLMWRVFALPCAIVAALVIEDEEARALEAFLEGLGLAPAAPGVRPCAWKGVACGENGYVVDLRKRQLGCK